MRRAGQATIGEVGRARAAHRLPVGRTPPAARGPAYCAPPVRRGRATIRGDVRVEPLTRPQQVLARRVAEAKATIPESLQTQVDMGAARERLTDGITADDLVVRAAALALRETPRANAAYRDAQAELYSRVNVGVAVRPAARSSTPRSSTPTASPWPRSPARSARWPSERGPARSPRRGRRRDVHGGRPRAHGVSAFTPVIAGGQAGILAAGAVREVPVVRDGAVVPGTS